MLIHSKTEKCGIFGVIVDTASTSASNVPKITHLLSGNRFFRHYKLYRLRY